MTFSDGVLPERLDTPSFSTRHSVRFAGAESSCSNMYLHKFDQARKHAESKAALGVAYAGVLA